MKAYIASVAIGISALFTIALLSQDKPAEPPKDTTPRKLDIERDRRNYLGTVAAYNLTLTEDQKKYIQSIQTLEKALNMKVDALKKDLGCEAKQMQFDNDTLECIGKPIDAKDAKQ